MPCCSIMVWVCTTRWAESREKKKKKTSTGLASSEWPSSILLDLTFRTQGLPFLHHLLTYQGLKDTYPNHSKSNLRVGQVWWYVALIPALGRQREAGLWVQGQTDLALSACPGYWSSELRTSCIYNKQLNPQSHVAPYTTWLLEVKKQARKRLGQRHKLMECIPRPNTY